MCIREIQEIEFDSLYDYLDWYAIQYKNQTGIKVTGLSEADGDKMRALYINISGN